MPTPPAPPLPGVTVLVKGTTIGTSTDTDGNFTLDVPEGATLTVSFIGYLKQEVALGSKTTVSVTLQTDDKSLNETLNEIPV